VSYISRSLRQKVVAAAQNRCGYCLTAQEISGGQMHIEHVIPLARGGTSDEANLMSSFGLHAVSGRWPAGILPLRDTVSPISQSSIGNHESNADPTPIHL
jgi:hypothetical protein